jgi:ubiquinone/menaquinone biosynthesis C-methylase UbiE
LSDSAVQRFYRYHAYVYDKTRWMILHGRRRAVAELQLRPDSEVLEVGCGTGLNFRHVLTDLDPQAGRLVGVDFSGDMLKQAEKRLARNGWQNVELQQADATQMDLGRRFDGILLAYSLTMIPDWRAALECARSHLKPGGRMVVLDFSKFHGWGPAGRIMRGWLKLNHVETRQPYVDVMAEMFDDFKCAHWLGGYNFTAVARRSPDDARD